MARSGRVAHRGHGVAGWGITIAALALLSWGVWSNHEASNRAWSHVSVLDQRTHVSR